MSKSKIPNPKSQILSLLVAMSENRVIGRGNALPWHLPNDLKRFKALTMGHAIIMGRRTFESIGKPLPGRRTIVISRHAGFRPPGVEVTNSLDAAIQLARGDDEIFIVGGGEVFAEAMPRADRIDLTLVHASIDGDTFFPAIDERQWVLKDDERHEADGRHEYAYSFRRYERRAQSRE